MNFTVAGLVMIFCLFAFLNLDKNPVCCDCVQSQEKKQTKYKKNYCENCHHKKAQSKEENHTKPTTASKTKWYITKYKPA